jgi:transposase
MKFVATKTADQLDLQALHRVRERLVSQRTGVINQIRAFLLERGIAVRQGHHFLRAELPRILAAPPNALSPRMMRAIEELALDWRRLDERIKGLSDEIEQLAKQDAGCERLMSIPGVGPIISSAMVAAVGTGDCFSKGRDFAAWLGLVPSQFSTGDRTILGKISKLSTHLIRAGGVGRSCEGEAEQMGGPRTQALDRGRQKAIASQRAGDRAGQQARTHRLERSGWGARLRSQQASSRLIIHELPSYLPAEVCERMRRDGGSVFPAHANPGDPNGRAEACPLMSSHAR